MFHNHQSHITATQKLNAINSTAVVLGIIMCGVFQSEVYAFIPSHNFLPITYEFETQQEPGSRNWGELGGSR